MSDVVICIPPFKRPQSLARLLDAIAALDTKADVSVLVAELVPTGPAVSLGRLAEAWEGLREGIDDYAYLRMLSDAIADARMSARQTVKDAADQAQATLDALTDAILGATQTDEQSVFAQRERVVARKERLATLSPAGNTLARQAAQLNVLADSLVRVAKGAGLPACALVTDMDQVLGRTAGNALEVREALDEGRFESWRAQFKADRARGVG